MAELFKSDDAPDSTSARIGFINSLYSKYMDYWRPDIERAIINARMYWHVNFGQWPTEVVEKLQSEGRRPPTMPVIPDKIETLVGSIVANGFDVSYLASRPEFDNLAMTLQDMYYSDQSNMSWEMAEIECLLNCCIYAGYERMTVNKKMNPFGNIAWESLNPRHVLLDPTWKNNNVNDLKNYIVFNDFSATQIMSMYPKVSEAIRERYQREKKYGIDPGKNEGAVPDDKAFQTKWGGLFRVIEFHSVDSKNASWEWDKVNGCYFPDTGYEIGSSEDRMVKMDYIMRTGLSVDDIAMVPRQLHTKRIESICPDLGSDMFLSKGLDQVQTGNVNLYPLGLRYNGQFQGVVVDRLYDLQLAINKGEMNTQDVMLRSAKGAFILDRALTGGDTNLEREIEESWNDPAARIWVDEGSTKNLPSGGILPLPTSNVPYDQYNSIGRYYEMSDRFSKVPAAMDARSESAKESGKLFRYKFEAGTIAQKYLMKFVEQHKRDKAEAYYDQAKILYQDGSRVFTDTKSGKAVIINTASEDAFDLAAAPRMKISIIPSPNGISVRTEQKNEYGEILSMLVDPNDRLLRLIVTGRILNLSEMSDKDREEVTKAVEMLKLQAFLQVASSIQQMQAPMAQPVQGAGAGMPEPAPATPMPVEQQIPL